MRALQLSYPWGTSNLSLVKQPEPRPGYGEVVLRMRAASLNFRDNMVAMMGAFTPMPEGSPPVIPLCDGCGIVEAVGKGVTRVEVGDRVSTLYFPGWEAGKQTPEKTALMLGMPGSDGAARELALFPESAVCRVPSFLTDQEVATLPCAGLTAWHALFVDAQLSPGDTVVMQGTGGVSIFALQFARAAGYRTIITSSSDEKLERAKALGADVLINYRTTPNWSEEVKAATGGKGADLVIEVGGAETLEQSFNAVCTAGHIAVIGNLSYKAEAPAFSPMTLIGSCAKLQGVLVGSREMFEAMCRTIELHRIRPVIGEVRPWTEAAQALDEMGRGSHFGKIVLEFN